MPSPSDMDTNSQYSSCETLDSYRSSECDEKNEVNGNSRGARKISAEHTDYIVKERVTRKEPPKPAYNPMQFVQIKPSNLCMSAQEQLKKAEEVKKVKEVAKKEDPEDWQNNLDNWKSSRRKRVEHIIDRVVEVKKLEEEEHDRNRRTIKTFSELMEERGSRRKLSSLAIYTEDDSKFDMSDLTPVVSDVNDSSDKMKTNSDNHSDKKQPNDTKASDDAFNNNNSNNNNKSSDMSNGNSTGDFHSTALIKDIIHKTPASAAHEEVGCDEKIEIEQRVTADLRSNVYSMSVSAKTQTTTNTVMSTKTIRSLESRERDYTYDDAIEDYKCRVSKTAKLDLPKVDITKRRELFEQAKDEVSNGNGNVSTAAAKLGTEIVSIKDRISSLRSNLSTSNVTVPTTKKLEVPVATKLKDRLSSLHQQISSPVDEPKRTIVDTTFKNVSEARNEFEMKQQQQQQQQQLQSLPLPITKSATDDNESLGSTDREDSGIHTTDISCSVSQADDQQPTERIEEFQRVIQEKFTNLNVNEKQQQQQPDVLEHVSQHVIEDEHPDMDENESSDDRIEEALDMAFQLIDSENIDSLPNRQMPINNINKSSDNNNHVSASIREPIYENIADDDACNNKKIDNVSPKMLDDVEPHYQVPRSREPYYEMPKKPTAPIPLYENVELMFPASSDSSRFSMAESNESFGIDDGTEMVFPIDQSKYLNQMPPKEKPPPPPIPMQADEMTGQEQIDNFKRINSTKRIKKEIRNKRSSFLGINGQEFDEENTLKMSVAPPPNIKSIMQEEKRLEKQLYQKVGLYENSVNGESRDSGLDNHSRQGSEPSSESSTSEGQPENTEEVDGGGMLLSERRGKFTSYTVNEDDNRMKSLEEQISKQEEVLRVEQLLLQIEQQELKRQRENLILRKNLVRRELDEGVKMLMTTNTSSSSLQDLSASNGMTNGGTQYDSNGNININSVNNNNNSNNSNNSVSYRHIHNTHSYQHNHINEYRKSMPNLQEFNAAAWNSSVNDIEYHQSIYNNTTSTTATSTSQSAFHHGSNMATTSSRSEMHLHAPKPYQGPNEHLHRNSLSNSSSNSNIYGNMTRHALMQISAVPKPKLTNDWVQYRKAEPTKPSINSHWLIQEAEQRRIEQMNNVRSSTGIGSNKRPLPESIIQTITQRVVDLGIGTNVNKRYTVFDSKQMPQITQTPTHVSPLLMMSQPQQQQQQPANIISSTTPNSNGQKIMHNPLQQQNHHHQQSAEMAMLSSQVPMLPQLDVLSVSSKKICSYCNRELGSGAAMIIENLGLFYHIDCFRCSVCQTQIADGNIHGTDVRVRNSRLHCANCFSNEEGIKFSCV